MDKEFLLIKKSIVRWFEKHSIVPDDGKVRLSQPIFNEKEVTAVLKTLLLNKGWIAQGPVTEMFEKEFAKYIGTRYAIATNSGSSANLIGIASLLDNGYLKIGDEVIVPASTFPTVVTPIIQLGLKPVFVDVGLDLNIDPVEIERAITSKTRMVMLVHSLGNPVNISKIRRIIKGKNILIFEDSCEAHGSAINGRKVGSFGDIGTFSFYVAHNMTTGEGGMIVTNDEKLSLSARSLREFGRFKGKNQDSRFSVRDPVLGNYDTRQLFSRIGYNMRLSDIEAALGIEQLKKLDALNRIRNRNASFYIRSLSKFNKYFILPEIKKNYYSAFYGFFLIIRPGAPFSRSSFVDFLEDCGIETRPLFGGCLPDQPAFRVLKPKTVGNLSNSRIIRDNALFIGVHPGISRSQAVKVVGTIRQFLKQYEQ